jgi:hypothetical protein
MVPGVEVVAADIAIDDGRQGIEIQRAQDLLARVVEAADLHQQRRVALACRRESWIELEYAPVGRVGIRPVVVANRADVRVRGMPDGIRPMRGFAHSLASELTQQLPIGHSGNAAFSSYAHRPMRSFAMAVALGKEPVIPDIM